MKFDIFGSWHGNTSNHRNKISLNLMVRRRVTWKFRKFEKAKLRIFLSQEVLASWIQPRKRKLHQAVVERKRFKVSFLSLRMKNEPWSPIISPRERESLLGLFSNIPKEYAHLDVIYLPKVAKIMTSHVDSWNKHWQKTKTREFRYEGLEGQGAW